MFWMALWFFWIGGFLIGAGVVSMLSPLTKEKRKDIALPVFLSFMAFISVSVIPEFLGLGKINFSIPDPYKGFIIALLIGGVIASLAVNRK